MKYAKHIFTALLLFSVLCFSAQKDSASKHGSLLWHTDLMKANEVSAASNKPIFAFFTGSDWCGWCKKIQMDVFSKPAFIEWASKNVVLLELDFPRGRQLPPELAQQNSDLQQTFRVTGYPTIWMFSMLKDGASGKYNINAYGSCGYPQGPERGREEVKFMSEANAILGKRSAK